MSDHWFYRERGRRPSSGTSSAPAPTRIPAGGIGESMEVFIRPGDERRIKALEPFMRYGPDYQRGISGALRDYSLFVKRGELDSAERYLAGAEELAARAHARGEK